MTGIKGSTIGMSNKNRLSRDIEGVEGSTVSTVRDVHGHTELVHALNDSEPEVGEANVTALVTAVAD